MHLSFNTSDLSLNYTFLNNSGGIFTDLRFFSFLDVEIDTPVNTFFNEYGEISGTMGSGTADADPDMWEIDEPGFVFGDIFDNLQRGALDNINAVPVGSPEDVSMALGFLLGDLAPLESATVNIFLSEQENSIGSLALTHLDLDPSSDTTITLSGESTVPVAPIPEPSTLLLLGSGLLLMATLGKRKR